MPTEVATAVDARVPVADWVAAVPLIYKLISVPAVVFAPV